MLLLLDNCEHVTSAVADLVDALTARLPRLRVLATSRQYRKRLAALDAALEHAEAHANEARHRALGAEREALVRELARATGLGGKVRRTGSPTEKASLNVTRTIRHAIGYLQTTFPELAQHLDESVATGIACSYEPRVNVTWTT